MTRLLLLLPVLACSGCTGLFEQRVIMPRPAVPVRLAADVHSALVLVKLEDGSYVQGYADLFAGEIVMADPLDFAPASIAPHAGPILRAQGFEPATK